jgi:hypothetical protein
MDSKWISQAVIVLVGLAPSCKQSSSVQGSGSGSSTGSAAYLTVGTYCTAFCQKLCATCGAGDCHDSCNKRCDYGRSPDLVFDGKDPKIALALTQPNLDACLATITSEGCMAIASGQVPPACYTIQH